MGFGWLALWMYGYNAPERHSRLSPAELAYIRGGQPAAVERMKVHWTTLLRYGNIWPSPKPAGRLDLPADSAILLSRVSPVSVAKLIVLKGQLGKSLNHKGHALRGWALAHARRTIGGSNACTREADSWGAS